MMNPASSEEIWFARIAVIFGARELMDTAVNFVTLLKVHSGLLIYMPSAGTEDRVVLTHLLVSAVLGLYLASGGRLLSRIAYGRPVPRAVLFGEVNLPDGSGLFSVAFRSFGIYQLIQGIYSTGLGLAHSHDVPQVSSAYLPRLSVVESVWALEHFVLGFALILGGGSIAHFLVGGRKSNPPSEPAPQPPGD